MLSAGECRKKYPHLKVRISHYYGEVIEELGESPDDPHKLLKRLEGIAEELQAISDAVEAHQLTGFGDLHHYQEQLWSVQLAVINLAIPGMPKIGSQRFIAFCQAEKDNPQALTMLSALHGQAKAIFAKLQNAHSTHENLEALQQAIKWQVWKFYDQYKNIYCYYYDNEDSVFAKAEYYKCYVLGAKKCLSTMLEYTPKDIFTAENYAQQYKDLCEFYDVYSLACYTASCEAVNMGDHERAYNYAVQATDVNSQAILLESGFPLVDAAMNGNPKRQVLKVVLHDLLACTSARREEKEFCYREIINSESDDPETNKSSYLLIYCHAAAQLGEQQAFAEAFPRLLQAFQDEPITDDPDEVNVITTYIQQYPGLRQQLYQSCAALKPCNELVKNLQDLVMQRCEIELSDAEESTTSHVKCNMAGQAASANASAFYAANGTRSHRQSATNSGERYSDEERDYALLLSNLTQ